MTARPDPPAGRGAGTPAPRVDRAAGTPTPVVDRAAGTPSPRVDPDASAPSPAVDRTAGAPRDLELEALLSRALELRDAGQTDWLAEACGARPEAQAAVLAAVERADSLPGWIDPGLPRVVARGQPLAGRFRLVDTIGAGAMGVVYLAEDLDLRRQVACKLVHHGLMPAEQALARFAREAEAMAAVQHPSVITVHDRGRTDEGQVYIVMELVDGVSLAAYLDEASGRAEGARGDDAAWIEAQLAISTRGESSRLRTVVRWVADLAAGLEAVHRAGVLHRDVKPSNVLLRRDGRPVLIDFGIAMLDGQGGGTRGGTSVGTPTYMPPEALRADAPRTPAGDVYGLAATLYHLLTLRAPYQGTPNEVLAQLATGEPVPAAKLRPGLPRDLQAVLEKGMHRNPARRYASAGAFEADLRAFLEYRPVAARPATALERGLRRIARSRAALGAAVAMLAVAAALGARAVRERSLEARRARLAEISRHLPPQFTIVGPANRECRYEADRAALAAQLDEAVEVAVEPLPTRLLRASFRQDHGDADGAAADMRAIADFVATPLARELAGLYATAAAERREVRGVAALDLQALPEPATATDRYLLGYHRLRAGKEREARELLGDPEVRRIPHAEELFLPLTEFKPLSIDQRRRLAVERYTEVVQLEQRLGGRTATTAHIAAGLLTMQGRYDEALRACAEGIELAPRAYVLRINAGWSAFLEGRADEAREHLGLARDLRPNYAHIVENLLRIEIAQGRFDAARELAREASPGLAPAPAGWLDIWSGTIAAYAALDARAAGDEPRLEREIALAREHLERVLDEKKRRSNDPYRIALALEDDEPQELLLVLLELAAKEPHSWWHRDLLLRHLPPKLDEPATEALRRVLEALDTRTPGDRSK